MSPIFGSSLWSPRPKTDYERWLENQGQDFEPGDTAQYHPPPPEDEEDSSSQHRQPHGSFLHHTNHHQTDGKHNDFFDTSNSQLPEGLRGPPNIPPPQDYGTVAMKLGALTVVILVILKLVRASQTKRPAPSPRLPQVEDPTPNGDKKHLI
ncbi:hypothetical protein AAWM_01270 [Aspergillus awamori]|uniref:Uncharacterized protein n=1 Tax=Aspergillus awamori TaxID=105351 RepID=A0A401KGU4_ASPAW|nr:hypothetical protein AAWM_01270 [Aspergillus awamori]GKZ54219.1 hypothetical protein AnigIFM49718_009622 [Aspergillus niger]